MMWEIDGKTIAVWVSCGLASAVAAKLTVEIYGSKNTVRLLNNPVKEEGDDNARFLADVEKWVGVKVESVTHPKYPNCSAVEVWDRNKAMSFVHGAPCTRILKKEARQIWEKTNHVDWHVLGFTSDELRRHSNFTLTERSNVLPILILSNMTKQDCADFVREAGLEIPEAYRLGYPNANCRGCVKMTSPTGWNHVRNIQPEIFAARAEQSRRLGDKLVRYKGRRIYLDELPADAKGRPMKSLRMPDCSSFCEEKF